MKLTRIPAMHFPRRAGGVLSVLVFLMVITIGIVGGGYYFWQSNRRSTQLNDVIVTEISRAPFDHIVLEQGELESASNVDVVCKVRARNGSTGTAILWVVDEGTVVQAGDKLVELDSSALKTALKEKKIVVISAEAAVAAAEAAVEQARITRQEYLEGLYQTEESLILSEMAIAQQDLRKAQLALESTQRLVAKGLVKSLQLEADQYAVANNRNLLQSAENRLKVLQNLTRQKMLVQFDSAINSAEAQLAAAQGALEEEESELRDLQKQIDLCTIVAPADGVVIHANSYSNRGGNAEFVVEPGAIIRERQTIIRLPDPKKMQVRANVNESRITLIRAGMPAKIRIDAINNMELLGRVSKVNRYAEPGSWFSSSIKEYATTIEILTPPETIRTGMTAEVQIFVEQLANALQVPIQAIYEHGGKTYSLVRKSLTEFETREVTIGATNEKMATVKSGLEEGESVVLNLRQNLNLMDLPEIVRQDNSEMQELNQVGQVPETEVEDGPSDRGPRSGAPDGGLPAGAKPMGERAPGAGGPEGARPNRMREGERPGRSDSSGLESGDSTDSVAQQVESKPKVESKQSADQTTDTTANSTAEKATSGNGEVGQ